MTPSTKIPEEAAFAVRVEFPQDSTNGEQYRKPFVDLPDLVDTHPNEEHHEIAVDFRRHELWNDTRHTLLLLRRRSSRAPATSRLVHLLARLTRRISRGALDSTAPSAACGVRQRLQLKNPICVCQRLPLETLAACQADRPPRSE